jgi:NADH:ubiquinone oxidoreductase subunit 3 (subunit A)
MSEKEKAMAYNCWLDQIDSKERWLVVQIYIIRMMFW